MCSWTTSTKAATSWSVTALPLADRRRRSNPARSRMAAASAAGRPPAWPRPRRRGSRPRARCANRASSVNRSAISGESVAVYQGSPSSCRHSTSRERRGAVLSTTAPAGDQRASQADEEVERRVVELQQALDRARRRGSARPAASPGAPMCLVPPPRDGGAAPVHRVLARASPGCGRAAGVAMNATRRTVSATPRTAMSRRNCTPGHEICVRRLVRACARLATIDARRGDVEHATAGGQRMRHRRRGRCRRGTR